MAAAAPDEWTEALLARHILVATGVRGVFGEGPAFIEVADAVSAAIRARAGDAPERMRFGATMPRALVERIGYFRSFPHLLGSVHCFCGDEAAHRRQLRLHDAGEDWSSDHAASDLVLIPAACYPVYPALAARGAVPAEGWTVQVEASCFRREPSDDIMRMQGFHMHEMVRVGTPEQALDFRRDWLERADALFDGWGLPHRIEIADDPFFGRTGVVMATAQRDRELKFELKLPFAGAEDLKACFSANYHLDKFGGALGLAHPDGAIAHSACVGFGIERIVLALFRRHGLEIARWETAVRVALAL